MYGRQTHMAIAEYWRWWVVHLWVEGFFEVFATVVAAFLFSRLGLLRIKVASTAVLFSTIVFLAGGILGTFHHLYFSATPTGVLALGATFSALESCLWYSSVTRHTTTTNCLKLPSGLKLINGLSTAL